MLRGMICISYSRHSQVRSVTKPIVVFAIMCLLTHSFSIANNYAWNLSGSFICNGWLE